MFLYGMLPDMTSAKISARTAEAWTRSRLLLQANVIVLALALVTLGWVCVHGLWWHLAAMGIASALLMGGWFWMRSMILRQAAVHHEMLQLQDIIMSFPSMIIGVDAEGHVVLMNTYASTLLELKADHDAGRTLKDVGLPIEWERLATQRPGIGSEGHRLDDIPVVRSSGETCYLGITIYWYPEEVGEIRMLLLGADITERRKLDALSLQNLKLESVGQLASGIAHEINTPLQFIGDNLDFLGEFINRMFTSAGGGMLCDLVAGRANPTAIADLNIAYLSHEVPQALLQSKDGVERITRIVRAMKSFSHPDTDIPSLINLNECMKDVVTIAHGQCKHAADVVMDFDTNLGPVLCHPGGISQVVLNLIINATHAIESANRGHGAIGRITIATRQKPDAVELTVTDSGSGIPVHVQRRIFDPFFTTKPLGVGTGQGLFIARRIVERGHGGTIRFETEVGKGTRFVVTLPANGISSRAPMEDVTHLELRSLTAEPILIPFPRT